MFGEETLSVRYLVNEMAAKRGLRVCHCLYSGEEDEFFFHPFTGDQVSPDDAVRDFAALLALKTAGSSTRFDVVRKSKVANTVTCEEEVEEDVLFVKVNL